MHRSPGSDLGTVSRLQSLTLCTCLRRTRVLSLVLVALIASASPTCAFAQSKNAGNQWLSIQSKESGNGPTLVLTLKDGSTKTLPATQDTVIISYLADKSWGHMPWLAVDLADRNRTLVQFALTAPLDIKSAELRMTRVNENPANPPEAFEVNFFALEEKWVENSTSWKSAPKYNPTSVQSATIDPNSKELRLDVTKAVQSALAKKAQEFGWLICVAKPLASAGGAVSTSKEVDDVQKKLLELLSWQKTPDEAKRLAKESKKRLLVLVGGTFDPKQLSPLESMLLAIAFTDPEVVHLVKSEFVSIRITYPPILHIAGDIPNQKDPLTPFGTTARAIKAPALLVCDAEGKLLASMTSIGTMNGDLVHRFLLESQNVDHIRNAKGKFIRDVSQSKKMGAKIGEAWYSRLEGKLADCERLAKELCSNAECQPAGQALLASCDMARSDFAEADKLLLKLLAIETKPKDAYLEYHHAVCLRRLGKRDESDKLLKSIAASSTDSPIRLRAQARLAWLEEIDQCESFAFVPKQSTPFTQTEIDGRKHEDRIVKEGVRYLLSQQASNGSWCAANQEMYTAAITALVGRCLLGWSDRLDQDAKLESLAACDRATAWLNNYLKKVDPAACESFGAAYLLEYFLDLEERKSPTQGNTTKAIAILLGGQCPHGGWSYNLNFAIGWHGGLGGWPKTDKGREHSMNTGPAMLALTRAKRMGHPIGEKPLSAGKNSLLAMRDAAGVYTYTYPVPRCYNTPDSSVGRACACELSLRRLGSATNEDMETTIELFLKNRKQLRVPVKLTESWVPPLGISNYFYFFAYSHAAYAIAEHDTKAAERLALLRDDLLSIVELDSTWIDFPEIGKPYATAMALDVIRLSRTHPVK